MKKLDQSSLKPFAKKYIWWKTPEDAMKYPSRVVAQVMDIGDYDDVQSITNLVGEDYLRRVLINAEAGQFSPRSWTYWHYKLELAELDKVPNLPKRVVQ